MIKCRLLDEKKKLAASGGKKFKKLIIVVKTPTFFAIFDTMAMSACSD
jgi:hypothetical protein